MKKIIATSSHTGGVNSIASVIRSLESDDFEVIVINPNDSKAFIKNNLEYRTLNYYDMDHDSNNVSTGFAHKILTEENPDDIGLLLLGQACQDDKTKDVLEHSLTLAAKEYGIPTVSVSDFWANRPQYFSDIFDSKNGNLKFLPTKITALDETHKKLMIKQNFPEDKIVVTGNPYFDKYKNLAETLSENKQRLIRTQLNIPIDEKIVLFASQPITKYHGNNYSNPDYLGYTEFSILKNISEIIESLNASSYSKINLIVKLHPQENKEDFSKFNGITFIDKDFDIVDAMLVSDVVTSMYSTVLVESTFLDKPSLSVQTGLIKDDPLPTNNMGITVPVYSNMRLRDTLEKTLFDNHYKNWLKLGRNKLVNDGKCTSRVKNLVYELMEYTS